MRRVALTARGPAAIGLGVLLLAGLFGLPRLLSTPLSPDQARGLIRELKLRQARDAFLPLPETSAADSAAALAGLVAAIKGAQDQPLGDVRVRRSWVGPPFARRWAYFVEMRRPGAPGRETYRISRGLAMETTRFWWHLPVF